MTARVRGGFGGGMRAVLERDFLVLTSAGKFVALRTAVVLVLAILGVSVLSALGMWSDTTGAQHDEWGKSLFVAFAVAYPILVCLVGPALASGSIAGERSTETLPLVLAAPVSPFSFVLAKYLSRLLALLVPLLGGLPIAALSFLYGGISPELFLAWAGVVLGLASIAVASSVLASAYAKTMAGAIILSFFFACVVPLCEAWGAFVVQHLMREAGWDWPAIVVEHTPINALGIVISGVFGRGMVGGHVWPFYVAAAGGTWLALALAAARLSRESHAMASGGPRRGRALRSFFANPVLDRATIGLPLRRGGAGAWATSVVIAGIAWAGVALSWGSERSWQVGVVIVGMNLGTWAVAIVLLARASQSLAVERQQGSLGVLRTTALSTGDLVDGKFLGLMVHGAVLLSPVLLLAAFGCVAGDADHRLPVASAGAWVATTGVVLLLFTAIGLRISATASTAGRAAGLAFGVTLGGMVVHLLIVLLVGLATGFGESSIVPVLAASPPYIVGVLTAAARGEFGGHDKSYLAWGVFWAVVWTLVAVTLLRATARAVEREGD